MGPEPSAETSEEYADAAAMHLPFVVPSLLQDINEGYLHPESPIVQNVVLPNLNQAGQTPPEMPPVSVKFQSFSDKLAAEKLAVVCTVDHDQAQTWASSPQVSLEVIQGISHTPHGPLIFLVWAIQMDHNNGVCIEQFLEPSSLLGPQFEEFATQQRFDFALVNRASGECVRGISYPTEGVFKETIVLAQTVESFEGTNMELAIDYFVKTTNLNDLLPERLRK